MSVRLEGITKFYGQQKALDRISLKVNSGEIVGILGPNGAGKSTMMKIITGILHPEEGIVWINDTPGVEQNIKIKSHIGYLPENNPLYHDLYIKEYLEFASGFYPIKNKNRRIQEVLDLTGLAKEKHKKIGNLSKGYRQRVGIAQSLVHDPSILILDEPTSGLDPSQIVEIRNLIRDVSSNKTVMLSTHIMQEAEALCNRIIIVNGGKIIVDESPEKIKTITSTKMPVLVEFTQKVEMELLSGIVGVTHIQAASGNKWILFGEEKDLRPEIFNFAVKNGLTIITLKEQESSLERVFLEMIK